jgi:hypothetical protein
MKYLYLALALLIGIFAITGTGLLLEVLTGSEVVRIVFTLAASFELGRRACKSAIGEYK